MLGKPICSFPEDSISQAKKKTQRSCSNIHLVNLLNHFLNRLIQRATVLSQLFLVLTFFLYFYLHYFVWLRRYIRKFIISDKYEGKI